ncbi:hypothetical protein [Streptomyces sp. MBT33]|uniref:hypothetical protein n=1 Tax=Streptomyces sp. MBT33 TaxID=1488363 RepID=UPI00190D95BA|nr:hypothetical protein [Streptomyces sp. MBT33]MBK3639563.1 hypothetical protein [Streptomyces sp. MBT33]
MEIELVGGAFDGRRLSVRREPTAPQPYLLVAEHLPLSDGNGEPTAVEALLASFEIVRYEHDAEADDRTGVRRRLYRRTSEPAV